MSNDRYELIDFGEGRKLESLAGHVIDRPCPAAADVRPHDRHQWKQAAARYDTASKAWSHRQPWPGNLDIDCGSFRMPVRPTPAGHIGLFPEQFENWQWLQQRPASEPTCNLALNLFGYTGASTMALVVAGYQVAHVDAAKPNVQALRAAALHNDRPDAAIRYLVDDAAKFAAREVRRGRRYHTIVIDPPAYGHSPGGKAWRIERDMWPLIRDCLQLLDPGSFRLLITGHSPQVDHTDVTQFLGQSEFLARSRAVSGLLLDSGRSQLRDQHGRRLDTGFFVRVQSRPA